MSFLACNTLKEGSALNANRTHAPSRSLCANRRQSPHLAWFVPLKPAPIALPSRQRIRKRFAPKRKRTKEAVQACYLPLPTIPLPFTTRAFCDAICEASPHSILYNHCSGEARGRLGKAYKDGTVEWATKGAVRQLVELLDKYTASTIPIFVAGSLGSVWADVTLTGGRGILRREKLVRLTPSWHGDKLIIMLDNTFDEEW